MGTNRLKACDSQLHPPTDGPRIRFDSAHSHSPLGEPADHCLLSPVHYEKNYAYPLVVWLHGGCLINGGRGGLREDLRELCGTEDYALVSLDYRLGPEV